MRRRGARAIDFGDVPRIGGKVNTLDIGRFVEDWYDLPLWKRDELLRGIQSQQAQTEAAEMARRRAEEDARLKGLGSAEAPPPAAEPPRAIESEPAPRYLLRPEVRTRPEATEPSFSTQAPWNYGG